MKRFFLGLSALGIATATTACSDDGPESGGTGGQGGDATTSSSASGAGGQDATSGAGGSGAGCPSASPPTLETDGDTCVSVGTVTGQVLDQDGNPPSTKTITVCGDACLYGELASDGTFSMEVNHCYGKSAFYGVPVMIYHGWPEYADVTVKIVPDGMTDVPVADTGVLTTVATSSMSKYAYSEQVAETFTDGAGFSVDVGDCELELPAFQEDVYVGAVALDDFPLGTPPPELVGLYFVAPDNSYFTAPAAVRFPNTTQLAPGTPVELMALGNMGTTTVIEAGTFDVIGTGRVSDDGMYVESLPGMDSGLSTLGWIGYGVVP